MAAVTFWVGYHTTKKHVKAHTSATDPQQGVLLFQMVLLSGVGWLVSKLQVGKGIPLG